ncbi:MAG TPA: tetratricopeptide repeat protein [Methylomirabilota bacterium]|nr:tetratricopeptide repeat protein [Methylomirabilota bacterium]
MKLPLKATVVVIALALPFLVAAKGDDQPIFVKWLVPGDPVDETIRIYWEQAAAGELGPLELVDLGTMLFERGWPKDAIGFFEEALDQDPKLSEAWFRIGAVRHRQGDLEDARSAYKKCLKLQSGHAWANFYLGLLEELSGNSKSALEHYERAFKHAPELADPRINPEILSSDLQLGARLRHFDGERFEHSLPMPFMEPAKVRTIRRQFEPEPEVVAIEPADAAQPEGAGGSASTAAPTRRAPAAAGAAGGPARTAPEQPLPSAEETPYGVPPVRRGTTPSPSGGAPEIKSTSPEASLGPLSPRLERLVEALI